ncbi:hypothetical protein M427DRAFT_486108 [Gonapodya prolifera JEL478]|uniref:Uncharacterized protein n=1 Tax=Gonapodya prolifera (strain JEL478) TaxID=1344416 RepID=A0A139AZT5_GONPJ|nr:hypothetical protein M427DRAFT_486108 [Gonapodya prolifera JEL478]|eukprot:KXS22239.1 hypothetical protein M427DRAFT_486108 [Gonapodya prolifera JEL478]
MFDTIAFGHSVYWISLPMLAHAAYHIYVQYPMDFHCKEYPLMALIAAFGMLFCHTFVYATGVGLIPFSYPSLYAILVGWTLYTQTLYHIILNRTSLMWRDRDQTRRMSVCLHIAIGVINVVVLVFWPAAQLGTCAFAVRFNDVFDKLEKVLLALLDAALNISFVYTFRKFTMALEDPAYQRAIKLSAILAIAGLGCDALILGLMFGNDPFIYTFAHVIAYPIKLLLELEMADLIKSTVKGSGAKFTLERITRSGGKSEDRTMMSVGAPWRSGNNFI